MPVSPEHLKLVSDEVGTLKDRLSRVETATLAQKAPLFAAQKVLEASREALAAATTGLEALLAAHQAAKSPKKPSRRRK